MNKNGSDVKNDYQILKFCQPRPCQAGALARIRSPYSSDVEERARGLSFGTTSPSTNPPSPTLEVTLTSVSSAFFISDLMSSLVTSENCLLRLMELLIQTPMMAKRQTARYGVEAERAPPDFPRGLHTTSIAALPLILVSWSRGMYAISLQGSNKEYLDDLLKMFCAAPTKTAAKSGVMPRAAMDGVRASEKSTNEKKAIPVTKSMIGVIKAAVPHPNFLKMNLETSIMVKVTIPV